VNLVHVNVKRENALLKNVKHTRIVMVISNTNMVLCATKTNVSLKLMVLELVTVTNNVLLV